MIVSEKSGFVFMHNPKVAGTSVRKELAKFRDTPFDIADIAPDPLTGAQIIDRAHIGIEEFSRYYPDIFARVGHLPFFMIWREPMNRFLAGLNQYSKTYGDVDIRFADPDKRRKFFLETVEMLDKIGAAEQTMENHELAFFRPQWIYKMPEIIGGKKIDVRAFHIKDMDNFRRELSGIVGADLKFDRENKSEQFAVSGPIGALLSNGSVKRRLRRVPGAAKMMEWLRRSNLSDTSVKSLEPAARFTLSPEEKSSFESFIQRFYGRDIELLTCNDPNLS